jgi:iron(II)-dependent oxidoreductase
MASATEILEKQQALSASFGSEPLLVHPGGRILDLATGYIPLFSTFTTEDKAAKGLRKGKETSTEPVYFSLLELVRDNQILLLSGPAGSGKSTFAKHLCFSLAGHNHAARSSVVSIAAIESWDHTGLQPCYFAITGPEDLEAPARHTIPTLLAASPTSNSSAGSVIVIDAIQNAGPDSADHIDSIAAQFLASSNKRHRLLFLGDTSAFGDLTIPLTIARYNIRPLSLVQRQYAISKATQVNPKLVEHALGGAASNPALFALALQAEHQGDQAEGLLDAWLETLAGTDISTACVERNAFGQVCLEVRHVPALEVRPESSSVELPFLARSRKIKQLLAARYLSNLPAELAVDLYKHNPILTAEIIQSLLIRLRNASPEKFDNLTQALLQEGDITSHRAALLIAKAGSISAGLEHQIRHAALAIVEEGQLPLAQRQDAASVLSRLGDPRDLTTLVDIPPSTITLGSTTHPNSQPTHNLHIAAFRIAAFPVTIHQYAAFTTATNRPWASPDQHDRSKQNFPATDLTWHDAVAYCNWLTPLWRANNTISENEQVRLPSEPEWEKAASGEQNTPGLSECLYPWGTSWQSDASNSEETGLNQPCAVGLFPKGRSVYGCYDMAGNVWEWCSTLWGEGMAAPSFCYPWRDDGREALEAKPEVRRVLRGGCFSSGRVKANCTYRGSLEPGGFWRGNGFRVVVGRC